MIALVLFVLSLLFISGEKPNYKFHHKIVQRANINDDFKHQYEKLESEIPIGKIEKEFNKRKNDHKFDENYAEILKDEFEIDEMGKNIIKRDTYLRNNVHENVAFSPELEDNENESVMISPETQEREPDGDEYVETANKNSRKLTLRPSLHAPRIYQGAPPGIHVTTIHAYNAENPRQEVKYNFSKVMDYEYFAIDETTGNLTTLKKIDREINQTYSVMVTLNTANVSELEPVDIVVTEYNQYSPRFLKRNYTIQLHPETDINKTVLTVKATDPDPEKVNSEIYYKKDQNITNRYFNLHPITGDLTLIQPINETGILKFGIFAEDGGSPKRWDYVPVYVHLITISAPSNVKVLNISHSNASICWEEPYHGDVLGYTITYYSKSNLEVKSVNVSVDYDMDVCHLLTMLDDNTEYTVQIYGWNEYEKGELSLPMKFNTPKNWCKSILCLNGGTCESFIDHDICHCKLGYYGPDCKYFNVCSAKPCGSNGKCVHITSNQYECICKEGYFGQNCSFYDECALHTGICENGGACTFSPDKKISCICPMGFTGETCNIKTCYFNFCLNGGTCMQVINDTPRCICKQGFRGDTCDRRVNYCDSNPCHSGSTCINNRREGFTCICDPAYYGITCSFRKNCTPDTTYSEKTQLLRWGITEVGSESKFNCPFGTIDSLGRQGFVRRSCLLKDGIPVWGEVDLSECKEEEVNAGELASLLLNLTQMPESLEIHEVNAAASALVHTARHAKEKEVAENYLEVISDCLDADEKVIGKTENEAIDNFIETIDILASNVDLEPGERLNIQSENIRVESFEWNPEIALEKTDEYDERIELDENIELDEHIELSAPMFKSSDFEEDNDYDTYPTETPGVTESSLLPNISLPTSSSNVTESTIPTDNITKTTESSSLPVFRVYVPSEVLREAYRNEKSVRLKFVVYYSDKFFQPKKTHKPTEAPVVKKEPAANESIPYEEPPLKVPVLQISVGKVALSNLQKPLVYILPMITSKRATCVFWNETERRWATEGLETQQRIDKVICKSSHMTAFSVLLDLDPDVEISETDDIILSYLSYVGSSLSIFGLTATLITYLLFKCMHRDHTGKILINLCFSLLMMNICFLIGSSNFINTKNACGIIAACVHYFVLASLFWMFIEALNMHQQLVHVFATVETHFMLKRIIITWGLPFLLVSIAAAYKFEAYTSNLDACFMSSNDPVMYYASFMTPCCLLLLLNLIIFFRVSRVIFTPTMKVRSSYTKHSKVSPMQVRGAFTVMILLGTTWIFGTFAFGKQKIIFQYIFCLTTSLQGFLIFIVRCVLYKEAQLAWRYLFNNGKLKRHRGGGPPGVSYSSHSAPSKSGQSPNTTVRTNSTNEDPSAGQGSFRSERAVHNLERTTSFISDSGCDCRYTHGSPMAPQYGSYEMQRRNDPKPLTTFQWRQPHQYQETRYASPYNQRRNERYPAEITIEIPLETFRVKKTQNVDANKDSFPDTSQKSKKNISRSPNFQERRDYVVGAASHCHRRIRSDETSKISPAPLIREKTNVKNQELHTPISYRREKRMKRQKAIPKSNICLDVDEGVHSESSSSNEIN